MKSFLVSFVTNPFEPNTMISSMMTMTIIFLALLLKISFWIKKLLEDTFIPNDEYIESDIIIYDDYRLTSAIDPLQNKIM